MNQIPPNALYSSNSGISSTSPFVEFFSLVDPTIYDVNFPIQKRWFNTTTNVEWILIGFSTSSGSLTANWQPISVGDDNDIIQHYALVGGPDHTITSVNPSTSGLVLTSNGPFVDPSFQPASLNSESQYATFLVNLTPGEGTHTTIQAAIDDASSGDTIWIYKGTYNENISGIPNGINVNAYGGSVTIVGKFDYSDAGTITLNGIILQTDSDYALAITGASVSNVIMNQGGINATDNTGILLTSTGGSLVCSNCNFDVSSTGITLFDGSGADPSFLISFKKCDILNSGISTTTIDYTCRLLLFYSDFRLPLSNTATSATSFIYSRLIANNTTFFTTASPSVDINYCYIVTGNATSIVSNSVLLGGHIFNCQFATTNPLAINDTNSTLTLSNNSFILSGNGINSANSASVQGLVGVSPFVGALGQLVRQTTPSGSAVSLTTNTPANVTSVLTLTPGTWTISGIIGFVTDPATSVTQIQLSLSTTSATLGTNYGLDTIANTFSAQIGIQQTLTLPSLVVTVTTNTDYYLVTQTTFTLNTMSAYGTITAQRTG